MDMLASPAGTTGSLRTSFINDLLNQAVARNRMQQLFTPLPVGRDTRSPLERKRRLGTAREPVPEPGPDVIERLLDFKREQQAAGRGTADREFALKERALTQRGDLAKAAQEQAAEAARATDAFRQAMLENQRQGMAADEAFRKAEQDFRMNDPVRQMAMLRFGRLKELLEGAGDRDLTPGSRADEARDRMLAEMGETTRAGQVQKIFEGLAPGLGTEARHFQEDAPSEIIDRLMAFQRRGGERAGRALGGLFTGPGGLGGEAGTGPEGQAFGEAVGGVLGKLPVHQFLLPGMVKDVLFPERAGEQVRSRIVARAEETLRTLKRAQASPDELRRAVDAIIQNNALDRRTSGILRQVLRRIMAEDQPLPTAPGQLPAAPSPGVPSGGAPGGPAAAFRSRLAGLR
jgi:hypothetical protein